MWRVYYRNLKVYIIFFVRISLKTVFFGPRYIIGTCKNAGLLQTEDILGVEHPPIHACSQKISNW